MQIEFQNQRKSIYQFKQHKIFYLKLIKLACFNNSTIFKNHYLNKKMSTADFQLSKESFEKSTSEVQAQPDLYESTQLDQSSKADSTLKLSYHATKPPLEHESPSCLNDEVDGLANQPQATMTQFVQNHYQPLPDWLNNAEDLQKQRVPIRLVFKHEKMKELAQANLKTHLVIALKELTIAQFLSEVLRAMKMYKVQRRQVQIRFKGWTSLAPIEFNHATILDKVHELICSIEETRCKTCEEEEPDRNVISAEIDLIDQDKSNEIQLHEQQRIREKRRNCNHTPNQKGTSCNLF